MKPEGLVLLDINKNLKRIADSLEELINGRK